MGPTDDEVSEWFLAMECRRYPRDPAAPSLAYMCEDCNFPVGFGKFHVSIPCAGIVGTKAIFEAMGCPHEYANVFDIEAAYEPVYRAIGVRPF